MSLRWPEDFEVGVEILRYRLRKKAPKAMSAVLNYRRKRLRDDFIRSGEIRKAQMKQLEKENEGRNSRPCSRTKAVTGVTSGNLRKQNSS